VAVVAATHWGFARASGLIIAQPVAREAELPADLAEAALTRAMTEAKERDLRGAAVTPYVLSRLHELTGGRSLEANTRLIQDNAALAAQIAVAYYAE
jgi:pseudouridylate synthase